MAQKRRKSVLRIANLEKAAARLFLKRGYAGVSLDEIIAQAGGSKGRIYSDFGGKSGLFISCIERLLREENEPLRCIDYAGLSLEQSLKKLAFGIMKLISSKRSVELHRLAVSEAAKHPKVGRAWYVHGPAETASFIRALLEQHPHEFLDHPIPASRLAVILHDALTADLLARLLAGVTLPDTDEQLRRTADGTVELILAHQYILSGTAAKPVSAEAARTRRSS